MDRSDEEQFYLYRAWTNCILCPLFNLHKLEIQSFLKWNLTQLVAHGTILWYAHGIFVLSQKSSRDPHHESAFISQSPQAVIMSDDYFNYATVYPNDSMALKG